MKKKQVKHFVTGKHPHVSKYGYPVCRCYKSKVVGYLIAFSDEGTQIRKKVTCGNCRRTRVFRKLK